MTWVLLSLLTAFSLSTADALSKRALRSTDEIVIVWVREAYAMPFVALTLFFVPIPTLDPMFFITLLVLLPLEVAALILYVKAIKISPLSLTVPFMALSPIFIIVIAFFMLDEVPDKSGFAGITLIVVGAYLLNASASKHGLFGPLKAIGKEKGSLLMIIVAIIYAITSTLGKIAVNHSSPVFFGFMYPLILTLILTVIIGRKGKLREGFSRPTTFIPIGFFTSVMMVSHFMAISMIDVAYMISVKRLSLIMSVFYGWALFKEERIRERLLGSIIMLVGVILITAF
ncbi:MAG: DMT family transporter [Thermodesulfobacteriota bacterium]